MLKQLAICGVLVTVGVSSFARAQSTLGETLRLITDTADRICSVVTTRGETQSTEVQGSIQAQLNRLASWLFNAGVSGSGTITSEQYQNVLREDLADVLRNNAECKVEVLKTLNTTILSSPGPFPQPSRDIPGQQYDPQQPSFAPPPPGPSVGAGPVPRPDTQWPPPAPSSKVCCSRGAFLCEVPATASGYCSCPNGAVGVVYDPGRC
jgi:hypothetical protein